MKARYFVIAALSVFWIFCNAESISNSDKNITGSRENHQQSKALIERYNKIRQGKKMNNIIQDTTLDNICRILITNKSYRNIDDTFNEDSVRHLLYESGVIDYQYEIIEVPDKDTTAIFKSIFLASNSNTICMGYSKSANKQILFKTINHHLQFYSWSFRVHSVTLGGFSDKTNAPVITDTIFCNLKTLKPGKYIYQLCNHIPTKSENLDYLKKYVAFTKKSNKNNNVYVLTFISTEPNKYFVISFNNIIIAIK